MPSIPSPFGSGDDDSFDERGSFVPDHLPDPGAFLAGQSVLTGEDHVAFHEVAWEVFEERTVYDMTFNYNLARLNLDTRHPSAGYRYAEEESPPDPDDAAADPPAAEDVRVLRAEFSPTTPFCPQSNTLTVGSFRAWNGLRDRHGYDLVRVRVRDTHHDSGAINEQLRALEAEFRETGEVPDAPDDAPSLDGVDGPGRKGPGSPF